MSTEQIERLLWQQLAARGAVHGEYAATLRTPWPIRLLMGAAGWLGALFAQLFLLGSVFAVTRGNGPAIAITGVLMISAAILMYRLTGHDSARIALGQFALAASLGGQGMLIVGVGETLGIDRLMQTAPFWLGVAALEVVLFAIVPNRLHRFVAALGAWAAATVALYVALGGSIRHPFLAMPFSVGIPGALAMAAVTAFVLVEGRIAAQRRHGLWEPAADATLLFGLAAALIVTGATHPFSILFDDARPWQMHGAWLPGVLLGIGLAAFALIECARTGCEARVRGALLLVSIAFSALMLMAPAVTAGVLALALALRRASLPWLGLAIAAIVLGFIWYYSTLQWTLLAKSATLAAAGALLLAARIALTRMPRKEVIA
ncbi:MAG: DUF4401 domain-containing protein [Cupriavidus sp.]|nr:DUF4401 domain-containing protein [Cupriavidus sp.]